MSQYQLPHYFWLSYPSPIVNNLKLKKKNKYIAEKLFTCSFRPAADRCRFWPREAINSAVKFEL
jgi:hypothetical protein